jgi:Methyltransferase domain
MTAAQPLVRRIPRPVVMAAAEFVAAQLAGMDGNPAHGLFYRRGFHLLRRHFYSAVPEAEDIPDGYWDQQSELAGVDLNEAAGLRLLSDVFPRSNAEFREMFPVERPRDWQPGQFYLLNGTFMAVDAQVYFAPIRHLRPRRIIEIGAGNSTLVALAAASANAAEAGVTTQLTVIDPFPWEVFRGAFPGLTLVEQRLQHLDRQIFDQLGEGDILFIDSSHVLRAGNDVEFEYLEILPRLRSGVCVHIHDISLPRRYPKVYFDGQNYWNEQQLLQAFLAFNAGFEVVWPASAMLIRHPAKVFETFPELAEMQRAFPASEPTSFWIRKT